MADVSIIVPIYNVEKFLPKCLDSIVENLSELNTYEIIIVDDASPDNSREIALHFSERFPNSRVISQKNKGLGGARNTGLENASGEFVFFLDSDDYLRNSDLADAVRCAHLYELDILEFGAERVDELYKHIDYIFKKADSAIYAGADYIAQFGFDNSVCNKLYSTKFLKEFQLKFFEKTFIEDAPFNAQAFMAAERVKSYDVIPVAFYTNHNSITRAKRTDAHLRKMIEDSIKVTTKIQDVADHSLRADSAQILQARVSTFSSGIALMILRSDFSVAEKKMFFRKFEASGLYPVRGRSGILIRDAFILLCNNPVILKLLLRLFPARKAGS